MREPEKSGQLVRAEQIYKNDKQLKACGCWLGGSIPVNHQTRKATGGWADLDGHLVHSDLRAGATVGAGVHRLESANSEFLPL